MYETLPVQRETRLIGNALKTTLTLLGGFRIEELVLRTGRMEVAVTDGSKIVRTCFNLPTAVEKDRASISCERHNGQQVVRVSTPVSTRTLPGLHPGQPGSARRKARLKAG